MSRDEQLNIMWERAFQLGSTLEGRRGWEYLAIANRIWMWIMERVAQ